MPLNPHASPLFPYTTLFRSGDAQAVEGNVPSKLFPVSLRQIVGDFARHPSAAKHPGEFVRARLGPAPEFAEHDPPVIEVMDQDRKSTRLNSSHGSISYAVFC